jgi:ribosome biogenesis GTPase YqeH
MKTTETDHVLGQCAGCGVHLQTTETDKTGYIPDSALEKDPLVCHRCYRIKHYNEASTVALDQNDFLKILNHVGQTNSLVVNIVDIFDFEGSLISGIGRFAGNNPIVLVVNKVDLLPKVVNPNKIINWIKKQTKEQGLQVVEVVLCSAKKNIGFDRVLHALDQHKKAKDIYVVGATNVGKSTLINRLIRDYSDLQNELTTSRYPGTTLDLVKIPLDDGTFIVDTPGIVYTSRLTEVVSKEDLKLIMPDQEIKPIVFQLKPEQSLFFGAMARFDFVQGAAQSFTCYVSNAIRIHRTKLEKADELYEQHKGVMLTPPSADRLEELPAWVKHSLRVGKGKQMDVMISGLGWIKVNADTGATLDVHAPKGVKVLLRESII